MTQQKDILLERARIELEQTYKDIGGCDHSVGLCCCDLKNLIDEIRIEIGQKPLFYQEEQYVENSEVEEAIDKILGPAGFKRVE